MKDIIEAAFEDRAHITPDSASQEVRQAVDEAIHLLDSGKARVAEQKGIGEWQVNEWLKKAVLLSFSLRIMPPYLQDLLSTMTRYPLSMQIQR